MSNNHAIIDALGLQCPSGGDPYVCEGSFFEFVGCCITNPCADYSGVCSQKNTKPANATSTYTEYTRREDKQFFVCRNAGYSRRDPTQWGWTNLQTGAPAAGNISCVGSVPYDFQDGPLITSYSNAISLTPYKELREELFSYARSQSGNTTGEPEHTAVPAPQSNHASGIDTGVTWGGLSQADIIGLSVGIFVFAVVLLALLGRSFWVSEMNKR